MNETTSRKPQPAERVARPAGRLDGGGLRYVTRLTPTDQREPVYLNYEILKVLPVVFVPGIMGSNLQSKEGYPVWRLDAVAGVPAGLALGKSKATAGKRQKDLHPDTTFVDDRGNVPGELVGSIHSAQEYRDRGWGEVGQGSYHAWLTLLEELLNDHRSGNAEAKRVAHHIAALMKLRPEGGEREAPWGAVRDFAALDAKEIEAMDGWFMPVYACGYNWLQDNKLSAEHLARRIEQVIARHHDGRNSFCKQVVLVTHSMGGLVARYCATRVAGMNARIAGIVHGVMPANGAAVAYRRCKVGMWDEDKVASLVIGQTGQETTAVFAQSPGALELLPTQNYTPRWLELQKPDGATVEQALPERDPYKEIYGKRDRWWGLVKEEWLAPVDGKPLRWGQYMRFLRDAQRFHASLTPTTYHPHTYAFYGADDKKAKTPSFERVVWRMQPGMFQPVSAPGAPASAAPTPEQVYDMTPQQVRMDGSNPEFVGGIPNQRVRDRVFNTSHWELRASRQDGTGDGTVPASSGRAPAECDKVKQVFRLIGVVHEPAYRHTTAQQVTVYSLVRIVQLALDPVPAPASASEAKR